MALSKASTLITRRVPNFSTAASKSTASEPITIIASGKFPMKVRVRVTSSDAGSEVLFAFDSQSIEGGGRSTAFVMGNGTTDEITLGPDQTLFAISTLGETFVSANVSEAVPIDWATLYGPFEYLAQEIAYTAGLSVYQMLGLDMSAMAPPPGCEEVNPQNQQFMQQPPGMRKQATPGSVKEIVPGQFVPRPGEGVPSSRRPRDGNNTLDPSRYRPQTPSARESDSASRFQQNVANRMAADSGKADLISRLMPRTRTHSAPTIDPSGMTTLSPTRTRTTTTTSLPTIDPSLTTRRR